MNICGQCRSYHVMDIDYEFHLYKDTTSSPSSPASMFSPSQNTRKRVIDYEYVYFLLYSQHDDHEDSKEEVKHPNQHGLLCRRRYDESYLEHLRQLGFEIPSALMYESSLSLSSSSASTQWVSNMQIKPYWGHHHDTNIERLLNSKITSAKLAKERGWGFHEDYATFVSTYEEVVHHIDKHGKDSDGNLRFDRWLLRRPLYSSGIGQKMFFASNFTRDTLANYLRDSCEEVENDDSNDCNDSDDANKVLLEPFYTRVVDIGTTFVIDSEGNILRHFMVENFIAESGGFSGGAGAKTYDIFKMYIEKKYGFYDLDVLLNKVKEIVQVYIGMGARGNVQIDSFVYKEGVNDHGDVKMRVYPLVEVNYRKTMGLVIQRLADMFTSKKSLQYIEWKLISRKQLQRANENEDIFSWDKNHYTLVYKGDDEGTICGSHHSSDHMLYWRQLSPPDNMVHSFFRVNAVS